MSYLDKMIELSEYPEVLSLKRDEYNKSAENFVLYDPEDFSPQVKAEAARLEGKQESPLN